MKKLLIVAAAMLFICLLAISVSATTFYVDENGTELFECEIADTYHIASYQVKNGGFAKADGDGDALTWYLVSTETVGEDIYKTVQSVKTKEVYANGVYTGVDKNKIVSANFDEEVNVVPSFGGYSGTFNKEILFVYVPDAVTVLPARFCQRTPVIKVEIGNDSQLNKFEYLAFYEAKSLREFFLPRNIVEFPTKDGRCFQNCTRLEIFTFHEDSQYKTMQPWVFADTGIKELVLPKNMTYLNSRAFQGMKKLQTVYFSPNITHIYKTENNHSLFHDCISLKTVYIPKGLTADNLIDKYGGGFDYSFSSGIDVTFVYTGTLEEFLEIKSVICSSSNNGQLSSATVENGRIVIADHCEVFYGGHKMSDKMEMQLTSYFEPIRFAGVCTNKDCGYSGVNESLTIGAIFEDLGYSATETPINGKHAMVQCYKFDKNAYNAYMALETGFEFGVVVSTNSDPLNPENAGLIEEKKTYITKQSLIAHDYFDVGVVGIGENQIGVSLVFCAFVIDNGEIFYLDGGETVKEATAKSHSGLIAGDYKK